MATENTKKTSSTTEKAADVKEAKVAVEPVAQKKVKASEKTAAPVPKKAAAEKPAPKKPAAKKPAAKKPAATKSAAKKDNNVKAVVEYYGRQVEEQDMIANVKKAWTKSGKKVRDIKTMELYIKPEEAAVYYVINGTDTGAVEF